MVDAVASALLDSEAEVAPRVRSFVLAYRDVPHDDAFTTYGATLLEHELRRRGLTELASDVHALLADRRATITRGFSR